MPEETMTTEELRTTFRSAAGDALDESDFVSADEARRIVDERLSKDDDVEVVDDDEAPESADYGDRDVLDRLEDHGVPDDLIEAVSEHLSRSGVEKALQAEQVDPYLAGELDRNASVLADQKEKAEERQEAIAESIAEGDAETPTLDATVYEEG
jgi:hypothetical protein